MMIKLYHLFWFLDLPELNGEQPDIAVDVFLNDDGEPSNEPSITKSGAYNFSNMLTLTN